MFETPAAAAAALAAWFAPEQVAQVVEAMVPAVLLHPAPADPGPGAGRPGASRLGGAPDGPPGLVWPRPPAPEDPESIATRGNSQAAADMRAHLARGLPYAFIAQIDLAEAAALGSVAAPLPAEGRLLFFYDLAIGPWETGAWPARVIWDRTPVADLAPVPVPEDLAEAIAREQAAIQALSAGVGADPGAGSTYGGPGQAVELRLGYRLLEMNALETDERLPVLEAARRSWRERGEDSGEAYDFLQAYEDALAEFQDWHLDSRWRVQQLLGSPLPVQDDPRCEAAGPSLLGMKFRSQEEYAARITAAAAEWTLLLQVHLRGWTQGAWPESEVYFLIRHDDLAARRFEAAVAVYQQG